MSLKPSQNVNSIEKVSLREPIKKCLRQLLRSTTAHLSRYIFGPEASFILCLIYDVQLFSLFPLKIFTFHYAMVN